MILSPFTNWVLQLFQIGPFWLLELAELLVVVGLILALTDKTTTIGLITAITRALTGNNKNFSIGVTPGYARRIGTVLILLGLVLSAAAIDGIASTPSVANYFSGGGPSLYQCLAPFTGFFCPTPSGSVTGGVCQNQVASCPNTFNQSGTDSCTITTVLCAVTNTFPTAFPTTPSHYGSQFTGGFVTTTVGQDVMIFNQEPVLAAEAFDTSALQSDILKTTSPMTFTLSVTPAAANEMAVVSTFISNNVTIPSGPVMIADTQNAVWTQTLPITLDGGFGDSAESIFTAKLPTTAADTITITWTDTGVTKDYVGGTVELFTNVDKVGTVASAAFLGGTSASTTITPLYSNDFIVGNAFNDFSIQTPPLVCDPITLSAPTTTRQTDANCSTNKRISFAAGDQHPSTTSLQTFTATFPDASTVDEGVVAVLDLIPLLAQGLYWSLTPTLGELFGDTWHEISYAVPSGIAATTVALHYTCVADTNASATVNIFLYTGTTNGAASLVNCNGLDFGGSTISFNGGGQQTFRVQGNTNPNGHTQILLTSIYLTVSYTYNQLPTLRTTGPSTTQIAFTCVFLTRVAASATCSWNWWVSYP